MNADAVSSTIQFDDSVLVRKARSGDPDAFARLVLKYQDRVYNAAWRVCGNLEDAQDITQEAFLRAMKGLKTFRGKSSFYTWLFRITMNLALSHERKAGHRMAISLDASDESGKAMSSRLASKKSEHPGAWVETGEVRSRIVSALHHLPEHYRAVVVLRDIEGFDYAGIAEVLEIDIGTVKSRLSRARNQLREALGPFVEPHGDQT